MLEQDPANTATEFKRLMGTGKAIEFPGAGISKKPEELSAEIHELPAPPRGFSSLRVQARIGLTRWRTSIFYNGSAYVLPLKRAVRDAEGFGEGDVIVVELEILDL